MSSINAKLLNMFKFSFDDTVWNDTAFTTTVTDDQLYELLQFVSTKDLSELDADESYYVFMRARREIYWKLATSKAPLYQISVDGTRVYKQERFEHYFQLISQIDLDIKRYEDSGMSYSIEVGDAFLTSHHHTMRNYQNTPTPEVVVSLDTIYDTKLELSWSVDKVTKFRNYIIYISNNNIIDNYRHRAFGSFHVANDDATVAYWSIDMRQTKCRIENLQPNTTYHLAVVCFNANTVFGYQEVEFTTLGVSS